MKIASISDVHLGPDAKRDRFRHDDGELLAFTTHLLETHDHAVLVGDIFQADWGLKLGPSGHEVDLILQRYARVWEHWKTPFFKLIVGNHDRVTLAHLGALTSWRASADNINVLYLHGDTHDKYIRGHMPDMTMWFVGRVRAAGLWRTANVMEDVLMQHGSVYLNKGDPVQRAAMALGLQTNSQVVVAGHSHCPICVRCDRVVYANSGAFHPDNYEYISVDTEQRTVQLVRYEPGRQVTIKARQTIAWSASASKDDSYPMPIWIDVLDR